jgi:hypothetical protein
MTLLILNPRKIACYTPYSRQVLPKHRKMVRMNFKHFVEEDLLWKMFINMKGYKHRMVSHWRLPEQNGISKEEILLSWKVTRMEENGIIKEVTIRWRTSKDDDKEVEMKIGNHSAWSSDWPKVWLFSVQSSSTEPKSDSSVSKVVQ